MSKKGFLASLILAIVFTLSLGIYTLVAVFNPGHSNTPTETTVALAFRNGEEVEQLKGYTEDENLTFELAEGVENPLEYNGETKTYITKDVNASVKAIIKKSNGDKINYEISVYHHNDKGLSAEEPYIVASKAHLMALATAINTTNVEQDKPTYINLVADVDLAGENWMPIGTAANPARSITFNGNGHTINNMTISINGENYKSYLSIKHQSVETDPIQNRATIDLGFFGQIRVKSFINNVKFKGASINVSAELYDILTGEIPADAEYDKFNYMSIGIVSGYSQYSKIDNVEVSGKINGYTCDNNISTGIGGVVGLMQYSQITNSNVAVEINNTYASVGRSYIGGVVGSIVALYPNANFTEADLLEYRSLIENVNVSVNAKVIYSNGSELGGIVARAENTLIKNVNVTSFKVLDTTAYQDIDTSVAVSSRTRVAGAAAYLYNYQTTASLSEEFLNGYKSEMINVHVHKVDVSAVASLATGLIIYAGGTTNSTDWVYGKDAGITLNITDCTVDGSISSREAIGLIHEACAEVVISYSEEFTGPAVNVSLKGTMATAGVNNLHGKMLGNANKVQVIARLYGRNQNINDNTNSAIRNVHRYTYSAGLAGVASQLDSSVMPEIKNFDVQVVATDIVSFAGVAFITDGATIDNVSVNADVKSYNYTKDEDNFSTTYSIAGAICEAFENTTVSNMDVRLNVNQNVDTAKKYGFNFFGGIIARIQENNVTVDNCTVSGNVYANYAYEKVAFEEAGGTTEFRSIFLAGGIVGTIQARGDNTAVIDGLLPVNTSNIVISNNKVSDLTIVADFKESSMTENGYRVKAIGSILGNAVIAQAGEGEDQIRLNLNRANAVSNFTVKADKVTFSYATNEPTTSINTIGVDADGTIVNAFGAANNSLLIDTQEDLDLSSAKYEALEA